MTSVLAAPGPPAHNMGPAVSDNNNNLPSLDADTHEQTLQEPTAGSTVPRGTVHATLNFYKPAQDGSPPHNYVEKQPEGQPQRNFGDNPAQIRVHDARGKESQFNLDKHAFATLQNHPHNPAIDWHDDASIKRHYYPEVERILLNEIPGSPNRILLFDHTVRRAEPNAHRAPVTRAHIDQTPKSAAQRVDFHLPEEAEKLKAGRYRIINVWRPLNGAVETHPLAFANSQTVPDDDMVPVEHRYPDRSGETAAIRHNEAHEWWYWSGIGDDERILLQCYDSERPMNRVPHSAFVDPRSTERSKPRESIEVRALVFG